MRGTITAVRAGGLQVQVQVGEGVATSWVEVSECCAPFAVVGARAVLADVGAVRDAELVVVAVLPAAP